MLPGSLLAPSMHLSFILLGYKTELFLIVGTCHLFLVCNFFFFADPFAESCPLSIFSRVSCPANFSALMAEVRSVSLGGSLLSYKKRLALWSD